MLLTAPTRIERDLTHAILNGEYAPGSHLPTVRELAASYGVNQATIQRVVARLETRGLVTARQGSGLAVNDPEVAGDLALLPVWIEATLDDPPRAVRLLDGFLEVRRTIAVRMLVRHRELLLARLAELAPVASALVASARGGTGAFWRADLAMTRRLLLAIGHPVALVVFNTVAKLLDQVPVVAEAMYGDPPANLSSWFTVIGALRTGDDDLIERSMADVDRQTLERFTRLLAQRELP